MPMLEIKEAEFYILLENIVKSVPFSVALATVLAINLIFNNTPISLVAEWYLMTAIISAVCWFYSKWALKQKYKRYHANAILMRFLFLIGLMGLTLGACYLIFLFYGTLAHEIIILLILTGTAVSAIFALSIYLPAFYVYIFSIYLPMISYNTYLYRIDRGVVAATLLFIVLMLVVIARISGQLITRSIQLDHDKEKLTNEIINKNERLQQSSKKIKSMTITDNLTGLYNRRHFYNMLKKEFNRAKRQGYSLSLVLIDIDNFKAINDTFGYSTGDVFLIDIANCLKNSIRRADDFIFRLGGDEFAVILANVPLDEALAVSDYIRNQFKVYIEHNNISLSMGVISIPATCSADFEHLISSAKKTLHEAKKQGKNQISSNEILH